MKKLILLIMFLGVLSGCNNVEETTIITPNGFPGLAHVTIENDDPYLRVERVSGPQVLVASFTSESHDIIIAPITMGTTMYNNGMPYQLVNVLTHSNLYFISQEPIDTVNDLVDLDIIAFGEHTINEMIISKVTKSIHISVNYRATSLQESYLQFVQGNADVAVISEPVLTQARQQFDDLYVIDIGQLYLSTVGEVFPQAGIFVHTDVDDVTLNYYLNALQSSIDALRDDPEAYAILAESIGHPFEVVVLSSALVNSGIKLLDPTDFTSFYSLVMDFDGSLIGNKIPDNNYFRDLE